MASASDPTNPDTPEFGLGPQAVNPTGTGQEPTSTNGWMSELGSLLFDLERVSSAGEVLPPVFSEPIDNQLIEVRLGLAASLFAALQCKHAASAGHSLRVALTSSAWALRMGLPSQERDAIEIAALLHDVGVIGVPDQILLKPGALDSDETIVMAQARHKSLEILRRSCASQEILDIVEHIPAWYSGARSDVRRMGKELPLGARMIAIVEAFDAMTTDHVYRRAMAHERAMTELFDYADTQFDRELVEQFAELMASDHAQMHQEVAGRWLRSLDEQLVNSYWQHNCVPSPTECALADALFQEKLLDNMYDAVVFIDAGGQVALWNRGAERLTGISGTSVTQRQWHPGLLRMADERGDTISESDCPVNGAIRSGAQSLRRLKIWGRTSNPISVDTHAIPVIGEDGTRRGAILLFHDASSETSLEQRCQNLHEKATRDPLTELANRAEFDRVHEMFVSTHQQQRVPCSLIIGDLDRFKLVNDTWGHQAGDDVIRCVATLLQGSCRPGDLVARYGGEEFVVLCADCDNATAARRAEQIRKALSQMPQPRMQGRPATISFGVTEIQPGDTPDTMLRRADRALLMAKNKGRNCVVQLGTGLCRDSEREQGAAGFKTRRSQGDQLLEKVLLTPVPIKMAIEKLRGFVADHEAKIVKISGNHVRLQITDKHPSRLRRLTDRPVVFGVDLRFEEERSREAQTPSEGVLRTKIHVSVNPTRTRDRRRGDVVTRAGEVLTSLRSYLMACEEEAKTADRAASRTKRFFAPWRTKKQ